MIVYRAATFGPKFIYQYEKTTTIIIIIKAFILVENSRKPLKLLFIRSSHYNWRMLCSQIHVLSDPNSFMHLYFMYLHSVCFGPVTLV